MAPLCFVLCLVLDCQLGLVGQLEQGMTQEQLPCGAASSASTSDHNEQQI